MCRRAHSCWSTAAGLLCPMTMFTSFKFRVLRTLSALAAAAAGATANASINPSERSTVVTHRDPVASSDGTSQASAETVRYPRIACCR